MLRLARSLALGFVLPALQDPKAPPPSPAAPDSFELFPGGTYDRAIPPPARLLGVPIGRRFTEHHQLVEVVRSYVQNSPFARLQPYGTTEEGRPLLLAFLSSPETLARLDEIRADLAVLVDPRGAAPDAVERALARLPVVVWLSFNVHGNEPSSSEAAIALLYQLVAGTDPRTEAIRKNALVILDPCLNPDGRERYVRWFNGIAGDQPDPHPASWEHFEPRPGGRTNHYYFDLNRDWAFLSQVESRARVAAYLRTPPQVHVDFHEMGASSSYFFFPPVYPVNANLPNDFVDWAKRFGRGNAAAFDRFGWAYYTRENFDLFYPGYGDSWPSFQGAIGMTYEQAGHAMAGLAIRRDDDQVLTLRERAWHHFMAAMATCETAVANRADLLRRFADWHRTAIEEGEREPVREYLIPEGDDPSRAAALAGLLVAQGIRVERAGEGFVAGPLHDFDGHDVDRESFPAGTYIVPLAQPRKRLARALLEPAPQLRDLYFYDVSAWSLPRAFGVAAYQLARPAVTPRAPYDGAPPRGQGIVGDPRTAYAFLVDWRQGNAPKLVSSLLHAGVRLSVATKELRLGGHEHKRGTIVIPAAGNGADLAERVRVRAEATGVTVVAVPTGLAEEGIDLGSDQVEPLRARKTLLVESPEMNDGSFGAVRYLLERSFQVPFTIVPLDRLGDVRLTDFGAIVFPDGRYLVPQDTVVKVRRWMEGGGVFVGLGGGALWATADYSGLTSVHRAKLSAAVAARASSAPAPARYVPAEQRRAESRRTGNPGAILKLDLDPASSVVYGCGDGPLYVLAAGEEGFDPQSSECAALYASEPRVAGFVGSDAVERLAGAAFAVAERAGRGRAVLFSEDPNFRLVWQGLTKAFLNALLMP